MTEKYFLYPKTIVQLADELKKICDDYWDRAIDEQELKNMITHWSKNTCLFYDCVIKEENLNKSVRKIIGKKRVELILLMIRG